VGPPAVVAHVRTTPSWVAVRQRPPSRLTPVCQIGAPGRMIDVHGHPMADDPTKPL
jgi:hypothetical protein